MRESISFHLSRQTLPGVNAELQQLQTPPVEPSGRMFLIAWRAGPNSAAVSSDYANLEQQQQELWESWWWFS